MISPLACSPGAAQCTLELDTPSPSPILEVRRLVIPALVSLPPQWASWRCFHLSASTVRAFRRLVLSRHQPLSASLNQIAMFGPWGIFGANITSGCFVTLDEVVTSTAICTVSSLSRPEPLGLMGSAPDDRPLVILLSAATLLFTVSTSDGRVIDSLWNLFSRPSLMIQRRADGSRWPVISSIQSGRQASYTYFPSSHSIKSRRQASRA
jgi:hypothetical protein